MDFLTPEVGWALLCAGYIHGGGVVLYRTTDGGSSWTLVPDQQAPGFSAGLGSLAGVPRELFVQSCTDATIHFLNSEHGILDAGSGVSVTSDGGRTWTTAGVPAFSPAALVSALQSSGAETFVAMWVVPATSGSTSPAAPAGGRKAKCPVPKTVAAVPPPESVNSFLSSRCRSLLQRQSLCEQFSVSTDGGLKWQESRIFAAGTVAPYSFLPSGEGWVGVGDPYLYHTTDAGQTWQVMTLQGVAAGRIVTGLQFLSPAVGWAVLAGTGGCGPTGSILAKTTDGGQSWVTVDPAFAMATA